ncbi:MAG: hypothetical protein R2822_13815 [Spirosomataceae bacterium]
MYDINDQTPTALSVEQKKETLTLQLKGKILPHILTIHVSKLPKEVKLDEKKIDFKYDGKRQKLLIKTDTYHQGFYKVYF